jgi:hypothetical protein
MSDDVVSLTVRLPEATMEQLRDELSSFRTEAGRFRYLAQFYLDYMKVERQTRVSSSVKNGHGSQVTQLDERSLKQSRDHSTPAHSVTGEDGEQHE